MALMTPQEYIESLRKLNTRVYMFGEKIENWVDPVSYTHQGPGERISVVPRRMAATVAPVACQNRRSPKFFPMPYQPSGTRQLRCV